MRLRLWLWRAAAWALALVPLGRLVWRGFHAQLTANPVEFVEHFTGLWALRLLLVTLTMTPLRNWTGWPEPIRIRRTLGLWAYAFACLHFSTYLVFDLEFSPAQLADDLVKRSYIALGFTAWLLLLPLAITSTNGWQRRLKRRWKTLHRLIYPAVVLGGLHYLWLVKADIRDPTIYLVLIALLLSYRLPWRGILRARSAPEPTP
jgi:sulfoxide reductase heme-binding subunit YedZ